MKKKIGEEVKIQKTRRIQVKTEQYGLSKEIVALIPDQGGLEARKYYDHMEKYRQEREMFDIF